MDVEFVFSLVIISAVAFIMIAIGVSQLKSTKPVGFYTGQKPPEEEQLTNVRQWNRKHGIMWIAYGVAMACTFFVGPAAGDSLYSTIALAAVVAGGLLLMVWYHGRLEKIFKINGKNDKQPDGEKSNVH